jgi:hypothetical protein
VRLARCGPLAVVLQPAVLHSVGVRTAGGAGVADAMFFVARDDVSSNRVMPTDYGLPRWHELPTFAGRTDAAGDVALSDCPAASFRVMVVHDAHPTASVETVAGTPSTTVVLPEHGRIEGVLMDRGRPADPGRFCVVAECAPQNGTPCPQLRATLRADGSFVFPALPPGSCVVSAEPNAEQSLSLATIVAVIQEVVMPMNWNDNPNQQRVTVRPGETTTVRFDTDPNQPLPGEVAARLFGRALENGVPFTGAVLELRTESYTWAPVATVAPDGTFQCDSLRPGTHDLRLREKGERWQALWEGAVEVAPGGDVELDLAWTTGPLSGAVTFLPGLPVSGYWAVATGSCSGGGLTRRVEVGTNGEFRFAGLPSGSYRVMAHGPDGRSPYVDVTIVAGAAMPRVTLELRETLALRGRVESQTDLSGALIMLEQPRSSYGTMLREDGAFAFSDLDPETYTLTLRLNGSRVELMPGTFDLRDGSRRDVVVRVVEQDR